LALNHYLAQLDNPQVKFSMRYKQPTNIDQVVQYTLEAESYLYPHKQQSLTTNTIPVAPVLRNSVAEELNTEQHAVEEQLVAATPTKSDPMLSIMKRLDEIESQLKSAINSRKWECSNRPMRPSQSSQTHSTEESKT